MAYKKGVFVGTARMAYKKGVFVGTTRMVYKKGVFMGTTRMVYKKESRHFHAKRDKIKNGVNLLKHMERR